MAAKGSTRRHVKFEWPLEFYAELYGQSIRTIKRWVRTGKTHRELPLLDDPGAMADWFERNHGWRRSKALLALKLAAAVARKYSRKQAAFLTRPDWR